MLSYIISLLDKTLLPMKRLKKTHLRKPMREGYNSLMENKTWELVSIPSNRELAGCKWVYRTKRVGIGMIQRIKISR